MKYRLMQKLNPLRPEAQRKWYASPVKKGTISNYQLSKEIAGQSSLTRGDVMNVLENIVDEMPKYLIEGYSVNFNNFGTLRLSLSSEGVDKREDFTADKIRNIRVVFTPSPEFKRMLKNVRFEREEE